MRIRPDIFQPFSRKKEVSEADVLRLALDRRLRLSIYFVNSAPAICGKVVGPEEIVWKSPPTILATRPDVPDGATAKPKPIMMSLHLGGKRFLNLGDEVTTISGVWDLPMIGNEREEIEREYQRLTGGPSVTLKHSEGTFVRNFPDTMCQLQESHDENPDVCGSRAALRKIKDYIANNNIEEQKAQELLYKHRQQRSEYLKEKRSKNYSEDFCTTYRFPEHSILVITTEALRDFEWELSKGEGTQKEPDSLSESERSSLLKLVLGMAISRYKYRPGAKRNPATGDKSGSISAELSRLSLNMDSDTVRKFIKEAEERFGDLIPKSDSS